MVLAGLSFLGPASMREVKSDLNRFLRSWVFESLKCNGLIWNAELGESSLLGVDRLE